jgi:hypothetical protein
MKAHFWLMIILLLVLTVIPAIAYCQENSLAEISTLKFSALAVEQGYGSCRLSFTVEAKKAAALEPILDVEKATQKSLEYFFLALVLPEEKFWVNLNPQEADKIVEPDLAATDLGRIMLAADLRLKKDVSELTNPRTSAVGREYWERLYAKAEALGIADKIPVSNRVWIIPDEVATRQTPKRINILQSRLKASLESEYLTQDAGIKDKEKKELQDYGIQLMRELILPVLNKKINESYFYADLRGVYQALILARWYKSNFGQQKNSLLQSASATVFEDLETDIPYGRDQIYQDYLDSFTKGEYDFVENKGAKLQLYLQAITRRYVSGGINLRKIEVVRNPPNFLVSPARPDSFSLQFEAYFPEGVVNPLGRAKQIVRTMFVPNQRNIAPGSNMPSLGPVASLLNNIERIVNTINAGASPNL